MKFKEINPSPRTLMTPGPVEADPRVLRAMGAHILGQFDPEFTALMNETTLMEETETEELFEHPLHPYTEALFEAVPDPYIKRKELKGLSGEQPVRTEDFKGCAFYTRCPYATDCCKAERPELREVKPGHKVACHRYNND